MNNDNLNNLDSEDSIDLKKAFFKYLFFWKYFLLSVVICLATAFTYIRYTDKILETNAKIKILDKKDSALELPSAEDLFSSSKINLENELEVIKSYSILEQVVRNLNLTTSVFSNGSIMSSLVLDYPFTITTKLPIDSLTEMVFNIDFQDEGLVIIDYQNEDKEYTFKDFATYGKKHNLPFDISKIDKNRCANQNYELSLNSIDKVVKSLKKEIITSQIGKSSDIISINFNSTNTQYSEKIVNELITVFNEDGVKDRQLIHKRTINFVNDRYRFLSFELDSIETNKQLFKVNNNLVSLEANSAISLEKNSLSEKDVFINENQISIGSSLLDVLKKSNFELLPANLGVENTGINTLINSYNLMILDRKKLLSSAGPQNPSVKIIDSSINDSRSNIIFSLQQHLLDLNTLNIKLFGQLNKFDDQLNQLPEKEKMLRSIERNQAIKEALYLFLLQKREESEVSYAITEPSIKVVEYAISNEKPISPNIKIIYLTTLLLGLIIPFGILYVIFLFDTKIHSREDIESHNSSLNILGEIPFFDINEEDKIFSDPSARSIISESFRMLMSNTRYLFKDNDTCNVMLVTSSIKGEGKTLIALNLSLAFASLDKKVLLVGCDLRNPQIHKYLDEDKNQKGLVDFLVDNKSNWKESTLKKFDKNPNLDILLSGALPPNPLYLINNGNFEILINQAKKEYDYIIIDTAPTLLVADTKSLFDLADAVIYLTRCNVTDKEILNHINDSVGVSKINTAVVLNGVGEQNSYGYSYGYKYGYGYNYKYSYNYGYGYGYEEDES
ncbi:MAG: polysaccharide biosynthesis tyrosine autokinase [Flavobacteriales bacterium]|jgi:capsular exopolysaccharide synthesis family protein|nr:polysaccharide biosynthesis tyrosine autokinase [Flavobacteriales bacterium]